ncbi:uncharacterized protein LOC117344028 [Pecten maximus]|uniref:uncharacterized protein LOC117344028 n=1 Tax=Pecten maximus TaxID=6579 RepID=UPI001458E0A9|nr:uncharacterized protein LOC117344028 [Pecten maximus]
MKNNLVFSGLAENPSENTELLLREFIQIELGIDHHIEFGNVHRFGRVVDGKKRPVVARFLFNKYRGNVLGCARRLKETAFYINEQFPTEIHQRRRELRPTIKELRSKGKNVRFERDKLIVDGRLYNGPVIIQNNGSKSPVPTMPRSTNSPSFSAVTRERVPTALPHRTSTRATVIIPKEKPGGILKDNIFATNRATPLHPVTVARDAHQEVAI